MKNCPNCKTEFTHRRENAHYCESCDSWFTEVDGIWRACPEPAKKQDAEPQPEPALPVRDRESASEMSHRENQPKTEDSRAARGDDLAPRGRTTGNAESEVKSYLGGLVTVTAVEDEDEETDD